MRITHLFAALLAVAGVSAITPASAETSLTRSTTIAAPIATPNATNANADQYRGRGGNRGWRGGGNRGWNGGGNRGWRGGGYGYRGGYGGRGWGRGYYRPRYGYYGGYRRGLVCRTSWRWGRPHRVCFRRW
jgi:uncharacterized membrane protein